MSSGVAADAVVAVVAPPGEAADDEALVDDELVADDPVNRTVVGVPYVTVPSIVVLVTKSRRSTLTVFVGSASVAAWAIDVESEDVSDTAPAAARTSTATQALTVCLRFTGQLAFVVGVVAVPLPFGRGPNPPPPPGPPPVMPSFVRQSVDAV